MLRCCDSLKQCWRVKEHADLHKGLSDSALDLGQKSTGLTRERTKKGVRKRSGFKKNSKNTSKCCPKLQAAYRNFVDTYSDIIVIATALVSITAFYNDFITDIQVLIFIANVPNYNWIALIMVSFMLCQFIFAVYAIESYFEVCT